MPCLKKEVLFKIALLINSSVVIFVDMLRSYCYTIIYSMNDLFRNFMGRDASPDALLKDRGIID